MEAEGVGDSVIMMCIFSIFQIRDGSMSSSPLLGTYCGVQIPPRLQSTQKSMYIRFQTDSSVSNHGFEASYGSVLEGVYYDSVSILAKIFSESLEIRFVYHYR